MIGRAPPPRRPSADPAVWLAAALLLAACPGEPPPAMPLPPAVVPEGPRAPDPQADGRLPPLAIPTHYALELDIDPAQTRFSGNVRIDVDVEKATSFIVLHAHAIEVRAARAEIANARIAARASMRAAHGAKSPEELVLAFATPLPPGRASLVVEYTAPFDDELSGMYRVQDGGLWYAYTQFEPTDARRAFPCFDEPARKTPFDLSVTVPRPMIAVANAPESSREEAENGHPNAKKTRFRFAETPPLPTYLVALAVGELQITEQPRSSKPPVRLITTKGKAISASGAKMGTLALEATGDLIDALAAWFGSPYPYDKLDIVAVPDFHAGAMENPGLVTFREELLLVDPARASLTTRREQALTIAHELAHQWFGNLVTASWWNDLWLNEGMATWMESRIVDKWRPALGARLDAVISAHEAMDADGLVSARAVRQPVVSNADAAEAFDAITYEKGAAVLQTIERWVGEDAFQRGVRDYLRESSWKSVQANRLLEALDRASEKDVTHMASAYLDKPGVPEVTARLECDPGARWHVELTSQQWRPLGSTLPEESDRSWTIPVCVRVQGEKKDTCTDLMAGAPSLLAGRGRCPTFVHPNSAASYYRFSVSEREFVRVAEGRAQLDVAARVSLLSNAWAAVRSGQLDAKALLKILPQFDEDNTRQVVEGVISILSSMSATVVDDAARVPFRKFALARLAKRKKALGWHPPANAKRDASSDDVLVRVVVLRAMGDIAEDEATLREAEEIGARWLSDPSSVDADTGAAALDLASRRGDDSRLTALRAAMTGAKSHEDRTTAMRAMFGFEDAALLSRALDVTLADEIHPNEIRYAMAAVFGRRTARTVGEAWVRAHWEALMKKLPGRLGGTVVRAAAVGCSKNDVDERTAFYTPRAAEIEGATRELAASLEAISLCAALREHGTPSLRRALLGAK